MQSINILNLLNYKLFTLKNKQYLKYIDKIISLDEFKISNIKITYLDIFVSSKYTNEIFSINKKGNIHFLHHQNLMKFDFTKEDLTSKTRTILNINIKNQQCYELIQTIIHLQSKFIHSNNKQDLKYFSHKEILHTHKKYYKTSLVSSNISTISHNTFYRDKNNNILKLSYLLPKQHFIIYIKCRYILNLHINMTDIQLSRYLKEKFDINSTKIKIFEIRKRYFIPSKKNRFQNIYLEYEKNYSISYALSYENLKPFRFIFGVYELLICEPYLYNYKNSSTVYIGSTNNIQRRLISYLSGFAHSLKIREFIKHKDIYFRVIKSDSYRELEKDILDAFHKTCGEYPVLNQNRIL